MLTDARLKSVHVCGRNKQTKIFLIYLLLLQRAAACAPASRFDIRSRLHQELAYMKMALRSGAYERSVLTVVTSDFQKRADESKRLDEQCS
jgi:hypothetical protein